MPTGGSTPVSLFKHRKWGITLLAVWLILAGLLLFVHEIPYSGPVSALVAIAAGVLILLDR
jgi:membrane-bound metal-dependent hydrolase YbcI (DUF457 family)